MKKLHIIATPIGNLKDITLRALEVLKEVDILLCEDTRVTQKLLSHYDIKVKTVSLHQHSTDDKIENLLKKYDNVGYASDAGTPGISDPGGKVAEIAYNLDYEVVTVPGPSALISALSISGFPTDKFTFLGFMPHKGKTKIFNLIKDSKHTTAFYESPHRIMKTLQAMRDFVPNRNIMIGRELTKKFESVYRGPIDQIITQVEDKQKGEFVVIISK